MKHDISKPMRWYRVPGMLGMLIVMAAIFAADTLTDYAIAAAVFYSAVILAASSWVSTRTLVALSGFCIFLTILSFYLTKFGSYQVGLINSGISIVAIAITTYLSLKMNAAKAAAYQAQTQLLRIARVTSLGELSTSIAHEVNQPLAAIVTSGNACQRWLDQDPPNLEKARLAVGRILSDANRASDIITRIRSLTKGEVPYKSRFDLNQAILEIVAMSRSDIEGHGISLNLDLSDDTPWVLADRVQIQQVIVNMILNATEAMTTNENQKRDMQILSTISEPGTVHFSIIDTGIGFPPGSIEHLFDPFWTAKESGIGLGLTISRTIIEANEGKIWAEQNPDGGAIVRFSLPIIEKGTP